MLCLCLPLAGLAAGITGFSPSFGQPGNVITVNGSGLSGATLVKLNNFAPTPADFTIVSDSQLQFVVPLGATSGPLEVDVGSSPLTSPSSFLVAPVITGFSPSTGTAPTIVSIQGANFVTNGTIVVFSGTNASVSGSVVALTEVVVTVPAGAANGPITVITSAGTNVSTNSFITSSAPTITGFSPAAAAIGAAVVINGGNFFTPVTVKFNGATAVASIVSTSQLNATVPSGATSGDISVTTADGSVTNTNEFFTGIGPIVTDFSPTIGTTNTPVTIDGLNLASATSVTFNGKTATITGDSSGQIQVYPPPGSGAGPIKVTTAKGSFTTSTNFTNATAPLVTDFTPVLGAAGTNVTIDGLNLAGVGSVTFNGVSASFSETGAGGTQISAKVPAGASTGAIKVTAGSSSYITSSNFTVFATAAPVVSGFIPAGGVRGQSVTLSGANFANLANPAVEFNGVPAAYQTPTSTSELIVTVPSGASSGPVTVFNNKGSGASSAYFYLQPWITGLSSNAAIVNATLTVTGRNFINASAMTINGVAYNYAASATQITATVPTNAGSGLIEITAPGGLIISTNVFAILPKIYSFTPGIGPAGTVVTLSGTSLFDVTAVQFGGVNAPVFTASTNQLRATVPAGGASGPITVVTPYGNDASSNSFTVTKPSLLVLTKTASPAISGPGTNVTYELVVTNEGPSIITGLSVTDAVPGLMTYVSSASSAGQCVYDNGQVVCDIGILTNNTSATMQVVAASTGAGAATNIASMGFVEWNLDSSGNTASAVARFVSAAQRTMSIEWLTNPPELLLTWPASSVSFLLQRSTNLALSNGWTAPAELPFLTNSMNAFTDSAAGSDAFYRLKSP